jgi:hypothetical protein
MICTEMHRLIAILLYINKQWENHCYLSILYAKYASSSEVSRSLYFSIKGCLLIVSQSGLFTGFFLKMKVTKLLNYGDPCSI